MLYWLGTKEVNVSPVVLDNVLVTRAKKYLSIGFCNKAGHNVYGRITVFRKGGGYMSKLRMIDYNRVICSSGIVVSYEYDFRHSAVVGCICYYIGLMVFVILPKGVNVGDPWEGFLRKESGTSNFVGNMSVGTMLHSIESVPGSGGWVARAAGLYAFVYIKRTSYVIVKLRSGILKKISNACIGSYGVVSNGFKKYLSDGKAGRSRFRNKRPSVRGLAMNPCDHPHGGGEGRKSQPRLPRTPWGKPGKWVSTKRKYNLI